MPDANQEGVHFRVVLSREEERRGGGVLISVFVVLQMLATSLAGRN